MTWLFLLAKMQSKTTEKPQNNNNIKIQECGPQFKAPYYGSVDELERVQKQTERGKKASEGSDYPRREAGG